MTMFVLVVMVMVMVMVAVVVTAMVMVGMMRRKDEEAEKRTGSIPHEIRSANCSCFLVS